MHPKHREFVKYYQNTERQGKEEGGLMDLKGMEMDFREDGGFVPIGKKERADDVPARLSKNEFVMTADAVRGAGDGNIDKGAQKMYNLMDKLEAENDQPQGFTNSLCFGCISAASGLISYILFQPLYCGSLSTSDIPPSALNASGTSPLAPFSLNSFGLNPVLLSLIHI